MIGLSSRLDHCRPAALFKFDQLECFFHASPVVLRARTSSTSSNHSACKMLQRLALTRAHLQTRAASSRARGLQAILEKRPDDVVITMAIRSPMCKAKKGGFKDTK